MKQIAKGDFVAGFDPGSRIAGYAIVQAKKDSAMLPQDFFVQEVGIIKLTTSETMMYRIKQLHEAAFKVMAAYSPTICCVEKAFFGINASSALKLGESRGAIISAAGRNNADIREISPTRIKHVITGKGRATKEEVAISLESLTSFRKGKLPFDATDALAVTLACMINQEPATQKNMCRNWHQIIKDKQKSLAPR